MGKLNYVKHESIRLKSHPDFDEKWLQERIEADPLILGLGDVVVVERERKQSSGGKIDFLLNNSETNTMYELEIMLGATDESHIIRTIEYWDIERRRFPSRDHKAVIVAEEITNRFFNVIALMNRSIPIIAIQLNALKIDDKIVLNFTKVLDIYEEPGEEEILDGEIKDRSYWEGMIHPRSLELFDGIADVFKGLYPDMRVTYNKWHIAIGTSRRNIFWFHHRKKEGYGHFGIRVGDNNIEKVKELSENSGIAASLRKEDEFTFAMTLDDFNKRKEAMNQLLDLAIKAYS